MSPLGEEVEYLPPGLTAAVAGAVLLLAAALAVLCAPRVETLKLGGVCETLVASCVSPSRRRVAAGGGAPDATANAEACWAQGLGRFKHCGLRPQPADPDSGPPEYSAEPLPLPLPQLSGRDRARLEDLGRRVADLSAHTRTDPGVLVRYLRARRWDVRSAEKYFREAAAWRRERGADRALREWNLEAYERCLAPWWLSGGFMGHGLRGEQVAYERLSCCNFPRLLKMLPREQLEKLDIVHCMRSLAACEEDSVRTGAPLGTGILVEDCEGFDWDQATLHAARRLNGLVSNRNMMMPECVTRILVIRAPAAWVYAWGLFKQMLDPGIADKVRVAGVGQSLALLRQYIGDEEIPAYLGGKKYIDGDPECRTVLAPGGPVPEEAIQRFLRLASDTGQGGDRRADAVWAGDHEPSAGAGICGLCPRRSDGLPSSPSGAQRSGARRCCD